MAHKLAGGCLRECTPQGIPLHGSDGAEDGGEEGVLVDDVQEAHLENFLSVMKDRLC